MTVSPRTIVIKPDLPIVGFAWPLKEAGETLPSMIDVSAWLTAMGLMIVGSPVITADPPLSAELISDTSSSLISVRVAGGDPGTLPRVHVTAPLSNGNALEIRVMQPIDGPKPADSADSMPAAALAGYFNPHETLTALGQMLGNDLRATVFPHTFALDATPSLALIASAAACNQAMMQVALASGKDVHIFAAGDVYCAGSLTATTSGQVVAGLGAKTRLRPTSSGGDFLVIGVNGGASDINCSLRDFTIWPIAAKTDGAAIKVYASGHLRISDVWLGTYEDATKGLLLCQGLELSDSGDVSIRGGGMLGCAANGILMYATAAAAEVQIADDVQIAFNGIGVQIAGGMGGVYIRGNIQQNSQGVVVSTAVSVATNREIFLTGAIIDSNVYEGFIAMPNSIAASLVITGGWCGGTATAMRGGMPVFGFSVGAGNAYTHVTGLRCDANAGKGAVFAGGTTMLTGFHADQNGQAGLTIKATCGAIYGSLIVSTNSASEHGIEFDAGYGYQCNMSVVCVLPNSLSGIGNRPNGTHQIICGVIA